MMKWPDRVQEIVETLAAGVGHGADDEVRRGTTRMIAEQCRFERVGGYEWGHKRADSGRPPSADVFCIKDPFVGWDWSVPSGVASFPDSIDLTGQVFIEVEPVDHIGVEPPEDMTDLKDRIRIIEQRIINDERAIQEAFGEVVTRLEEAESRILGILLKFKEPLSVRGKTKGTAFHSHEIDLEVTRG